MDIMKPTQPAVPHKDISQGLAAIDNAEETLSDFKKVSKPATEEATNLVKAAKDLVKEVIFNCDESNKKLHSGEWTQGQFDQARVNLRQKQEKAWEALHAKADVLKQKLEGPYKLVLASKENITRARGDNVTGAVFGMLTEDQKQVRKVFDNKLKFGFEEAAVAYSGLASYPDGLLTQIAGLQKQANERLNVGVTCPEQAK